MQRQISLVVFMLFVLPSAWPATKSFSCWCRTKIVCGEHVYYENRCHTYQFTIQVVSDTSGYKSEYFQYSQPFIYASPAERYSVVITNPMPVRVAVNLMIDGLNSITGNPGGPASGFKWLLEPYSSETISGWQVSQESQRRFYFTSIEDSYARWRSYQLGQNLTVKCGRISAAYFWSKQDLENYFELHPIYETPYLPPYPMMDDAEGTCETSAPTDVRREKEQKAGTGMGEKVAHSVEIVQFYYDTGMYQESDMVSIYYDFQPPYYPYPPYRPEEDTPYAPEK